MRTRRNDYDSPLDSVEESEGEIKDSSDLPVVLDDPPSVPDPLRLSDCPGAWEIISLTTWTTVEVVLWQCGIVTRVGPRALHCRLKDTLQILAKDTEAAQSSLQ